QTAAILARDWERAGTELKVNLYNRLLEHGLTPEEATAVLDQDWAALTEHGKARLTELAAARWSVSPDLVRAVLDQDWETARSHAEIVILEYLLNALLQAANAYPDRPRGRARPRPRARPGPRAIPCRRWLETGYWGVL